MRGVVSNACSLITSRLTVAPPSFAFSSISLVGARGHLARILWLLGYAEQAMRAAESSIDPARAINYALNLCFALTYFACPIALLVGDLAMAELYVRLVIDHSRRHGLVLWQAFGRSHVPSRPFDRVTPGVPIFPSGSLDRPACGSLALPLGRE
jgi:hypothetical protein